MIETKSPGKILLTGGYTILEEDNSGIVLTVDSYVTTTSSINRSYDPLKIYVFSKNTEEKHLFELVEGKLNHSCTNSFLREAVLCAFELFMLNECEPTGSISIEVDGDKQFYCQGGKTGLGSSAALICSLLTNTYYALLSTIKKLTDYSISPTILGACLVANNNASGKIGSGFDIQACLLGSHIFTQRNLAKRLKTIQDIFMIQNELEDLFETVNSLKYRVKPLENTQIALIIPSNGSDTRQMVRKVIAKAKEVMNEKLFDDPVFNKLASIYNQIASEEINITVLAKYNSLIRSALKEVCKLTETEIEPAEATQIIDDLLKMKGVHYAIVPGAGGFDAIVAICDDVSTIQSEMTLPVLPLNFSPIGTSTRII